MTVYVEYVIIDNMAFDCLILWAVNSTLRLRGKRWRVILGGVVGTACAFLTVFLKDVWGIVLKTVCLFAMCVTACGFGKKLFWHILLTAAYTFILGGAIIGLFYLFGTDFAAGVNLSYSSEVPIGLYVLGAGIFVFLARAVLSYIRTARHRQPFTKKIKIVCGSVKEEAYGFLDSGNSLRKDGVPVCFAMKSLRKKISREVAEAILKGCAESISLETVTGRQNVFAVKAEITLDNKRYGVYLALSENSSDVEYAVLLNAAMLEVNDETDEIIGKTA